MRRISALLFWVPLSLLVTSSPAQPNWQSGDKISMAYYFYWYDIHTYQHFLERVGDAYNNSLTHHPPDSYIPDYSWTTAAWHRREILDIMDANLDVILPVYWGDSFETYWSQPGLENLVQATRDLIAEGVNPPKIGMFFDTSSFPRENGHTPPDLRTGQGKEIFYRLIKDFFDRVPSDLVARIDGRPVIVLYAATGFAAAWDQSTFTYLDTRMQNDFGATPYIIRELSWTNVETEGMYAWGVALGGALQFGHVATIGPGYDETALDGRQPPRVQDRECGNFYERNWEKVIGGNPEIVMIETWNEFHEGTEIAPTQEFGRRYVDLTAYYVDRWKAAEPPSDDLAWIATGSEPYGQNLSIAFKAGDGVWLSTSIADHEGIYPDRSSNPASHYVYFQINDAFHSEAAGAVWVTVEYFDSDRASWWAVQYDAVGAPYKSTEVVWPQGTGRWRLHTFHLPDAFFGGRENGGADFRLVTNPGGETNYFGRIWISKSAPAGDPATLKGLPDLVVNPGQVVEVPVKVDLDKVDLNLQTGASFITLRENANGTRFLRVAPSAEHLRPCPYRARIEALPDDAASFQVMVTDQRKNFYLPQVGDGRFADSIFFTDLVFGNAGAATTLELEFFNGSGNPMAVEFAGLGSKSRHLVNLGKGESRTLQTAGTGPLRTGYCRVTAGLGVSGTAVFTYRKAGVVHYQTGVPGVVPVKQSTLILDFAEGSKATGFAVVNTEQQPADVTLRLFRRNAQFVAEHAFVLPALGHLAQYAEEFLPVIRDQAIEGGTITIESNREIAAVTLRQEQDPALRPSSRVSTTSTFPVIPGKAGEASAPASEAVYYFPQIVSGRSDIILFDTDLYFANTGASAEVEVRFYDTTGDPMQLQIVGRGTHSVFEFPLASGESVVLESVAGEGLKVGYARVMTRDGVGGTAVFTRSDNGILLFQVGVPAVTEIHDFQIAFDLSGGLHNTGLSVVNLSDVETLLVMHFYDESYHLIGEETCKLGPGDHWARYVSEISEDLAGDVIERGLMTLHSDQPLAALTLRQRDDPARVFPQDIALITAFPVMAGRPNQ